MRSHSTKEPDGLADWHHHARFGRGGAIATMAKVRFATKSKGTPLVCYRRLRER